MSDNTNDEAFTEAYYAILRRPQIDPNHPHYQQAQVAVTAEIDRVNTGGATLTGNLARINAPELLTPLATRYAAQVLDLLGTQQVAIGRGDLHAAVGHLALQAAVGKLAAAGTDPDDLPPA